MVQSTAPAVVGVVALLVVTLLLSNAIAACVSRARQGRIESKRDALAATAQRGGGGGPIPVTVLTGFLGAGKTVLLNRLLSSPGGRRICVIENEAGAVSIDHALIAATRSEPTASGGAGSHGAVSVTVLKNGCMCCSGGGAGDELERTLDKLLAAAGREGARPPPFDHVIIETSGLVDPSPLVQTFFRADVARAWKLDGIIAVVDAKHIGAHLSGKGLLSRTVEAGRQIAFADLVLLNKVDVATREQVAVATAAIHDINPTAAVVHTRYCVVPVETVLNRGGWDMVPEHVADLMVEATGEGGNAVGGQARGNHTPGLATITVAADLHDVAVSQQALHRWLQEVVLEHHARLYRVKALVRVYDDGVDVHADGGWTWFAVHGVHGDVQGSGVEFAQPHVNPTPALVLIGHDLPESTLASSFRQHVLATALHVRRPPVPPTAAAVAAGLAHGCADGMCTHAHHHTAAPAHGGHARRRRRGSGT